VGVVGVAGVKGLLNHPKKYTNLPTITKQTLCSVAVHCSAVKFQNQNTMQAHF
jgi:hypothetical protein